MLPVETTLLNRVMAIAGYHMDPASSNASAADILWRSLLYALRDLINVLPLIILSLIIIAIYSIVAYMLTKLLRSFFELVRLDDLFAPLREYRIKLSSIFILLIDIGIAILAVYSIALIIMPQNIQLITTIVIYVGKIASVIFITLFTFIFLETIIEKIRMEAKMRGFMFLLILFITLALIVDVTALSEEVKHSLTLGISLGIGLMIGVFAVWYFFHDIIERKFKDSNQ